LEAESLATNPIIFGDFIKVGAAREDRVYEELNNIDKVKISLNDVGFTLSAYLPDRFHRICL